MPPHIPTAPLELRGPTEWDCTAHFQTLKDTTGFDSRAVLRQIDKTGSWRDDALEFQNDPAAPGWVRRRRHKPFAIALAADPFDPEIVAVTAALGAPVHLVDLDDAEAIHLAHSDADLRRELAAALRELERRPNATLLRDDIHLLRVEIAARTARAMSLSTEET